MFLQLDEKIVLAENVDIIGNEFIRLVRLVLDQRARNLASDAGAR